MEKKYRLQIDFTEDAYGELERLENQTGASSKSDVIRTALGVLRIVCDEVRDDNRILVERKTPKGSPEVREIVFHFIKHPYSSSRSEATKSTADKK